jgi:WD40 repeat protein
MADGTVVTRSLREGVRIWSATGKLRHTLGTSAPRCVVELPERNIAVGGDTLDVWNVAEGRLEKRLFGPGHYGQASRLPYGPQPLGTRINHAVWLGDRLVSLTTGVMLVWRDRRLARSIVSKNLSSAHKLVALDRKFVATCKNSYVYVWDTGLGELRSMLAGHRGDVLDIVSLSGDRLASASLDRTVRVWSSDGCHTVVMNEMCSALGVLADGRLASVSVSSVRIWDTDEVNDEGAATLKATLWHNSPVSRLLPLGNGHVVTACDDGSVHRWR